MKSFLLISCSVALAFFCFPDSSNGQSLALASQSDLDFDKGLEYEAPANLLVRTARAHEKEKLRRHAGMLPYVIFPPPLWSAFRQEERLVPAGEGAALLQDKVRFARLINWITGRSAAGGQQVQKPRVG
ncbi:hypothetical protein BV898_17920 [Hypsibius exemplaris]|uniref:Uncharacterized protein n=1 Tax=Hypsibius exemplaris TaxID=2072580 RepID=A0A9X6RMH8_HYPEX|nr:hypothetical protein BV898_17920 [Hypsibius exemplaris]